MKTLTRYIAVVMLLLVSATAHADQHKLTVVSTVGNNIMINFYHLNANLTIVQDGLERDGAGISYSMETGDSILISAFMNYGWKYSYMECEGQVIHKLGDNNNRMKYDYGMGGAVTFIMGDHDVTVYVYAELDPTTPDLPGTPNGCSWNASTGELFISGFMPNEDLYLYTYTTKMGIKNEDVRKVTVMGELGKTELRLGYEYSDEQYPNVETIDLRHVYNFTCYDNLSQSLGFISGTPNLKKLILPSDIRYITSVVWSAIPLLEEVTIYSIAPPSFLWGDYQQSIPASCKLYVPEQSVAAYKADENWSRFAAVLPIPEGDAADITVDLPDDFTDGRYVGMSLRLFNAKTGEETKYVIDERGSYIFRSKTCDEPYTAQLLTAKNVLLATTDTVTLGDRSMEMTFRNVKKLYDLTLQVMTPAKSLGYDPEDVTGQTTVVWTDAMGNRIGTGSRLARQIEGTRLLYGISLPTELASHYGVPARTELIVGENTMNTTVMLARPDTLTLRGRVVSSDGEPVTQATVTVSQMMNGVVGKTFIATTNQLGRYEVTALAGDVTVSVTAQGYEAQRRELTIDNGQLTVDVEPIQLALLTGPTIVYNFTYTPTVGIDEEAVVQPGYSDYRNVAIAAYNETTGKQLDSVMVQYPEIQLLSGAKAGDRIRLTATSMVDAFMPVEVTSTLDEEESDTVTIAIVQKGAIEASFQRTDNNAVTASLYDADGKLVDAYAFDEANITISELPDGQYTLVMMGSDPLFSKILSLSDYGTVGLTEGTDYVKNEVTVHSGATAVVNNVTVPLLDADQFYYTDDTKTLFMANRSEVNASCNVTLRAEIGFKDEYKERVSNVRLIVDYPSSMTEFVEGSTMTGNKMVRATVENGRLSIPVEKEFLNEPVRFILTTLEQGRLMSSAYVQFTIDGREVTQPIGTAWCKVNSMVISAPQKVNKLDFPVCGVAQPLCPVRLYAGNNVLIGETWSLSDGSWQMRAELPSAANLVEIPIYAIITVKQGREIKTETVEVTYDQNMIRPLHVYMYPPLQSGKTISDTEHRYIDFDFDHPEKNSSQWYTAFVHIPQPFFFEIEFNTADSSKVHNVVLDVMTVKGEYYFVPAEYYAGTGRWVCSLDLQEDAVCNVNVDYLETSEPLLDSDMQFVAAHWQEYYNESMNAYADEVERLVELMGSETNIDKRRELINEFCELVGVDLESTDDVPPEGMTLDEVFAMIEQDLAEINLSAEDFLNGKDMFTTDFGDNISITHPDGLTPEQLLAEGYNPLSVTDGSTLYELTTENVYVLVDFQNNLRMEIRDDGQSSMLNLQRREGEDYVTFCNRYISLIRTKYDELNVLVELSKFKAGDAYKFFSKLAKTLDKDIKHLMKVWYAPGTPPLTNAQTKTLVDLSSKKNICESIKESCFMLHKDGLDPGRVGTKVLPKTPLGQAMNASLKVLKSIGEVFSYLAILNDVKEGMDRVKELLEVWQDVPDPCEEDQADATRLKKEIESFAHYQANYFKCLAVADLLATGLVKTGIVALVPSVGTSITEVFSSIGMTLYKLIANDLNDKTYNYKMQYFRGEIELLDCDDDYREKQEKRRRAALRAEAGRPWMLHMYNVNAIIDPSGYVYEAVEGNRVENATATIYYKQTGEDEYGDMHDEVVMWNAEEFRQQNPLLTDAEGRYAWDVPQGLWQVKIEKDGYETAYSDWLPVPPPQLDINIPLVQKALPEVQRVRAYEDGVEVMFNKYMSPNTLTTDRIILSQNGQALPCRIVLLDRENAYGSDNAYASRLKVVTDKPLVSGSKVQLTVRRQVESYAGLQMQNDYQQEFVVVSEVYAIGTDSLVEVAKDDERTITVHAFPASAAEGMTVSAKTIIGTVATVTSQAVFNNKGEAQITVKGNVGGQTSLQLSLEGTSIKGQSIIVVDDPKALTVYAPTSSHISGSYVMEGESIMLHTDTEGATIWYTTDGTCPCDENGTRKEYIAPIPVTKAVTIRAYAVKGDDVSRVVTFHYDIFDPTGIETIDNGQLTIDNAAWYTIDGIELNGKPTRKGVYIVNGKKVVVK